MQEYRDYHRTFMRASLQIQRSATQIETCRSLCCVPRVHEELYGPFQMKWLQRSLRRSDTRPSLSFSILFEDITSPPRIISALESLQPLIIASKRQRAAVDGWAHVLRSEPHARAQLESALRPLLTEEVRRILATNNSIDLVLRAILPADPQRLFS